MNYKPFKTHEELILLLEQRNISFPSAESKSFAKKKLQRIGYYNLINGYSPLFLEPSTPNKYKEGTTIDQIYSLYKFDEKLREIFLHNILPLEMNIKSLVAYHFPKEHPETNYLVFDNFNTKKADSNKNITSLIAEIQRQIASHSSDPSVSHYLKNYGYLPLWVLNNVLTFGTISKFYSLMQVKERQEISKTFHILDNVLESALFYISSLRNFCAHGNRVYCYRSKNPLCNTSIHSMLNIPKSPTNEYMYGKRDLFAALIVFKLLLSKRDFRRLIKDIDIGIKNMMARITVLSETEILDSLGFPSDWKAKLLAK